LIHSDWGWLALVAGGVLVPTMPGRRLAAGGLGALALALGALRVGGGPGRLPGDFAAVELALVLIGAAGPAAAVLPTVRGSRRGAAGAALIAAGVVLLLRDLRALAHAAPIGGTAAALAVVAGTAALTWVAAGMVLRRAPPPPVAGRDEGIDLRWTGCAAAGVFLAALGPHILLIFTGVILAAVAVGAETLGRRRYSAAWPVVITLAALGPAGWLLATIAGDQRLATVALPDLPLSPAAEALLAPLVLLAAWSLAGLWPLRRSRLTGLAGLAGLFLVARLAIPALPEGLDHWRPLAYPILSLGLWQAVVSRRWPAGLIGGALFALISRTPDGSAAAWWLGAAALAAGIAQHTARRELAWLSCLAGLAAGIGALPATAAGLEREVVYTTFAVAGLAVLLAAGRPASRAAPGW
jgi:hypothetical protein